LTERFRGLTEYAGDGDGLVFLNGLIATPSTPGIRLCASRFFKMVGAAPQTPRGSSSRLVFDETARVSGFPQAHAFFLLVFFLFIHLFIRAGDHASRGFEGCYSAFFRSIPSFSEFTPSFSGLFRLFPIYSVMFH